jgi:hypothetical protein
MKPRLALPNVAGRLHGPLRFGRLWRGHELALRIVQLAVLIVLAAVGAKLVAEGVAMAVRAIAGLIS